MTKCPKCGSTVIQKSYDQDACCIMCGFTLVRISEDVRREVIESIGEKKIKSDQLRGWRKSSDGIKI